MRDFSLDTWSPKDLHIYLFISKIVSALVTFLRDILCQQESHRIQQSRQFQSTISIQDYIQGVCPGMKRTSCFVRQFQSDLKSKK